MLWGTLKWTRGVDKVKELDAALAAHVVWMSDLRQAIVNATATPGVECVRADDKCPFGRWLYGSSLSLEERATDYYREVRQLHAEFHEVGARVLELAGQGRVFEAYRILYGEYLTMSGRLALAIRAWQKALQQTD
ncbi:MAG TPA: CZB domain-containing protein [Accumulibacter sp.]|uniref:CZB domain-containing protein n=1 Tax=Accumulibacter sp. TaxID=2053492 RepID=UPI002C8B63AD|nr:CZB domain-containing protein [Accumulibacter sp.]HMV04662.1 CZB domain-containing protein [Accumulibacter sp.]HND40230.1 CZB domain-containing protein [Accumulibacter sp.]HNE38702.1 CZB domain-containing protein [Accumulibacter sp.]HNG15576.1 CZB domain-containing protein [Accumulibacter sp.]HNG88016.1 CZB domain-containing protein [Accumulibacter sp.]